MRNIPYQYAPYLNINNNLKNEKNEFILVTTTGNVNKKSKIAVSIKNDKNVTANSLKSPVSVISSENVLSFIKDYKPPIFPDNKNDLVEPPLEPPKPMTNKDEPSPRNLNFIENDVFNSKNATPQGSLDIINCKFTSLIDIEEKEKEKEEQEQEQEQEEKEKEKEENDNKGKALQVQVNTESKISPVIKSAIEGFKTDVAASPFSATPFNPANSNSIAIRNDLQSNMNGTVFQNQRFHTYLESLNTINQSDLVNPSSQPLHINRKKIISENRNQLRHLYDINRYTFDKAIKEYDESEEKIKDLAPMKEEEISEWLNTATPEEIYENMNKLIGIPRKINVMSKKTKEVICPDDSPVFGLEQYYYKEAKAFAPLSAKFKNETVTLYVKDNDLCCTSQYKSSKLKVFPFPLHIVIGVSYCDNILNVHIVVQNPSKDYCIKTLSFVTPAETIASIYSNILFQNVYFDDQSILSTSFVQIYVDKDNEDLRKFVNRWFRVSFELANCYYEIINDINQISPSAQVFIFMTQKKELHKSVEKMNIWNDNTSIVHQTIYGHPLQVIMAALKERLYERWMLEYNEWKRYK